jgi:hypothetical protein
MVKAAGRRVRSRGRRAPEVIRPEATGPEAALERLLSGALRAAEEEFAALEDPLAAEAWGSRLLSLTDGVDDLTPLVPLAEAEFTRPALALLMVLGAVGPSALARRAKAAASRMTGLGVPPPRWAELVGRAAAREAWSGSDVFGDQEVVLVGFSYPDGNEHTVSVLIDHNLCGAALDAHPTAPLAEVLPAWWASEGIAMRPLSLTEAAARLSAALAVTDMTQGVPVRPGLVAIRSLLAARVAAMPTRRRRAGDNGDGAGAGGTAGARALVSEFLASPEAAGLPAGVAVARLCSELIDYRSRLGDGQPLRWSPVLVARCLLEFLPTRLSGDECAPVLPEVLEAWVRWAGARRGVAPEALERTVGAVSECRAGFLTATGVASG